MNVVETSSAKKDRRVRRAKDRSEFLGKLTNAGAGGVFPYMRDAIGFAAAVGYMIEKREPFKESAEPIAWDTFLHGRGFEDLALMLAAAAVDDVTILAEERLDECLSIFEEYANGGLRYLEQIVGDRPLLDALTTLILEQEEQVGGIDDILDELVGHR